MATVNAIMDAIFTSYNIPILRLYPECIDQHWKKKEEVELPFCVLTLCCCYCCCWCWYCSIFGGLLRRDEFIDRFSFGCLQKGWRPDRWTLLTFFPSENVFGECLVSSTKLCNAVYVESSRHKRFSIWLAGCAGTHVVVHISFGKYFVAFFFFLIISCLVNKRNNERNDHVHWSV